MSEKILVGVSGGVDSTVSALRLRDLGYDVTAAHLILKDGEDPTDRLRLERLAQHVPVHRLDCREQFDDRVVRPFLDAYRKGLTPNPCVICNAALKFRALFELADRLGIEKVASGHYARVLKRGDRWAIGRPRRRIRRTCCAGCRTNGCRGSVSRFRKSGIKQA